ncbi:MAG: hypothetical protein NC548_25590 [Lachnospiraceae bacterium]|nr:hypothetical protein [Lachnospiraceae bacterium]
MNLDKLTYDNIDHIEIVFENVDLVKIDTEFIDDFMILGIKQNVFGKIHDHENLSCEYVRIRFKDSLSSVTYLEFGCEEQKVEERIAQWNDITSIEFYLRDGDKIIINPEWSLDANDYTNPGQYYNKKYHCLTIDKDNREPLD